MPDVHDQQVFIPFVASDEAIPGFLIGVSLVAFSRPLYNQLRLEGSEACCCIVPFSFEFQNHVITHRAGVVLGWVFIETYTA